MNNSMSTASHTVIVSHDMVYLDLSNDTMATLNAKIAQISLTLEDPSLPMEHQFMFGLFVDHLNIIDMISRRWCQLD